MLWMRTSDHHGSFSNRRCDESRPEEYESFGVLDLKDDDQLSRETTQERGFGSFSQVMEVAGVEKCSGLQMSAGLVSQGVGAAGTSTAGTAGSGQIGSPWRSTVAGEYLQQLRGVHKRRGLCVGIDDEGLKRCVKN
eukprot:3262894-Rhodomonas_salina.3